ncbi:MAG: DUF1284 domain-containing protein [Candidatus Nanoarchaeia archaeon]|nr:DUF1284 domain-containing protein [Candidatus Nanoarchaeia archaeon]
MVTIRLRPHHLTAIEDYLYRPKETVEGLKNCGYSQEYIDNERDTIWKILTDKDCKVEIVPALDDLCRACRPKRLRCFQNDPAGVMGYMDSLRLQVGKPYSARDIVRKIQDKYEINRAFREAQQR